MNILLLIARFLFSAIFILSGVSHLTNNRIVSMYAESKKVPLPRLAVFVTGIVLLLGGISILVGFWVKIGALLIAILLIFVATIMHNFWTIANPTDRQNELVNFMKDLALAGAAFLIWYLYAAVEHVPWSFM